MDGFVQEDLALLDLDLLLGERLDDVACANRAVQGPIGRRALADFERGVGEPPLCAKEPLLRVLPRPVLRRLGDDELGAVLRCLLQNTAFCTQLS